jgi:hypothetical protein
VLGSCLGKGYKVRDVKNKAAASLGYWLIGPGCHHRSAPFFPYAISQTTPGATSLSRIPFHPSIYPTSFRLAATQTGDQYAALLIRRVVREHTTLQSGCKQKIPRVKATGSSTPPAAKLRFIEPMYARLAQSLPPGQEWLYEVKLDGYRCLAGRERRVSASGQGEKTCSRSNSHKSPKRVNGSRAIPSLMEKSWPWMQAGGGFHLTSYNITALKRRH